MPVGTLQTVAFVGLDCKRPGKGRNCQCVLHLGAALVVKGWRAQGLQGLMFR
jgi:hypothetical protein